MHSRVGGLGLCLLGVFSALAQSPSPATRADLEEGLRSRKAAELRPPEPDKVERVFLRTLANPFVKSFLAPTTGWNIKFGDLYSGSGFALGPSFSRKGLLKENLNLGFSAVGSIRQYYTVAASASIPHLFEDRAVLDFEVKRMDAPRVDYYGPGNDSSGLVRTNYRYENVEADTRIGIRPFRRVLTLGAYAGWSKNNVGPGQNSSIPSTDQVFTPATAPGINRQTDYAYAGPFAMLDLRDFPGDPHRGTAAGFAYAWHHGLTYDDYSYRRLRLGVEHYIPILNDKRVFALMILGQFSYVDRDSAVPIYQQITLGGPDDLRGYPRFRFYDNNSLTANAEYRWEVAPGFDMALFADAGKVMSRPGNLKLSELHGAGGFGFRFKTREATVMRIDFGFSPDGVKFWWTFNSLQRAFLRNPF